MGKNDYEAVTSVRDDSYPDTGGMAAGLTDHIWTLKEVFSMVVIKNNT
jgi:hypothetical protein